MDLSRLLATSRIPVNLLRGVSISFCFLTILDALPVLAGWQWVRAQKGDVPDGSVIGGTDINGETLYICSVGNATGKLVPSHKKCYVGFGGQSPGYEVYSTLVGNNLAWYLFNGSIPQGAVSGGQEFGEPVYVCRVIYQRNWTPGKYIPSHNTCYIGFGGREISIRDFQILVGR